VARRDDGTARLVRDDRSRHPGRGAYVCRRAECFDRAVARRGFQRATRSGAALVIDPALAEGVAHGNRERT
jgi:predicted RNA-binding protein YlxR (DUF448 family)